MLRGFVSQIPARDQKCVFWLQMLEATLSHSSIRFDYIQVVQLLLVILLLLWWLLILVSGLAVEVFVKGVVIFRERSLA